MHYAVADLRGGGGGGGGGGREGSPPLKSEIYKNIKQTSPNVPLDNVGGLQPYIISHPPPKPPIPIPKWIIWIRYWYNAGQLTSE